MPGCRILYNFDGAKRGRVYEADSLRVELEPGWRLYYYSSADISADTHTIEAYYTLR
jgi:hypothetical protein